MIRRARLDEHCAGEATFKCVFEDPCESRRRRILTTRRLFALLAWLCILSTTTWAEQLPLRLYTTEDGLWSGFINHIMRDSHGFLWFCTRDGLSRFDGYRFTNYRIGGELSSQNFTYMFETRDGIFWIVLSDNRVYRYDPLSITVSVKSGTQLTPTDQRNDDGRVALQARLVSSDDLTGMLQDRDGNVWAGGKGLFRVEDKAGKVSFSEINLNLPAGWKPLFEVSTFAEGNDGSLWLGTTRGLLRRLPDGRVAHYYLNQENAPEDVRRLLADRDGYIWAVHLGGAYVLRPEPLSAMAGLGAFSSRRVTARLLGPQTALPTMASHAMVVATGGTSGREAREISDIYQLSNGRIWLTVKDKLALFDGRQLHSFVDSRFAFRPRGTESGAVLSEDLDGDLWFVVHGGVVRLSGQGLTSYGRADGLGAQEIASIYEDQDGRLDVVSPGWLISRREEAVFKSIRADIPQSGSMWTSPLAFLDHTGQWWFLTRRGLYRFRGARRVEDLARVRPTRYTDLDGLPGQWAYCMFEDSRGDLWISVSGAEQPAVAGLARWRRSDESFHRFTEAEGMPPLRSAASFGEDRAGNLWFGFYEDGLVRYTAGRFTSFGPADGLPEGFITALHVDRLGRLWLTSSMGGAARIDDPAAERPSFVHYTTREGLASNNARAMAEDVSGDMYIGTVRGVDRLTPETGKVRHYGVADGLAGDFVTTAYRDRSGLLWFGTFSGLSRLDPQPEPVPSAPSIRIEGLRVAGAKQPLGEFGASAIAGLELSAAQSNLEIDFSSLSMAQAASLRYQYQLLGVDSDWSALTDQRTVNYASLSPGSYRFLVRAVYPSGVSSEQPASVDFRILPPIWRQWWFVTLAVLVIGSAVYLLYRYRLSRLLELERVRTHIATDLHDDIGASLSQIAVLSEVARRQVGGSAPASQPLSTIATTSRELVDSMSDIVWAINPHRDNLTDLAQRMRRFASDLFTANEIDFHFNARDIERTVKLDADTRRQVFLIFKESIHNIVRHSECSRVEVDLHMDKHMLTLTLSDNGKGFDTGRAYHGHGLTSMTQRAKSLGAVLEATSQPGRGTIVSLTVPLGRHGARH
jgi:signal transduction histidine kinase/ligand-binding sensor domain-containing protein